MSNKSLVYLTSLQWMAAMLCGPAGLCAQSRVQEVSGREHGHAQTQHPCTGGETAAVLGRLFNKGLATPTFVQVGTNACSFGFVFGDIENVSIDLRPHHRFDGDDAHALSF